MLIRDLGRETGEVRGWKKHVAGELEITPEHLSRVLAGTRRIGWQTMRRAAERLGFRMEYFFDAEGSSSYRDYLLADTPEPAPPAPSMAFPPAIRQLALGTLESVARQELDLPKAVALAHLVLDLPVFQEAQRLIQAEREGRPTFRHALHLAAAAVLLTSPMLEDDEEAWRIAQMLDPDVESRSS